MEREKKTQRNLHPVRIDEGLHREKKSKTTSEDPCIISLRRMVQQDRDLVHMGTSDLVFKIN
jgi:hypothetical protein